MNALAVRHGGAAVTIVQRGVVIALRPGDGHAPALCIVGETAPRLVVIGPADDPVRSVVLIKQVVVQPRIRFCQPPPRILFVGRQRLYAVIRAVNGFQVAAGVVRQFKPDPVGVTDTRDPVLAVALKRDAVDIATSSKMNNDPYRTTADNVISGTTSDVIREGTENAMVM